MFASIHLYMSISISLRVAPHLCRPSPQWLAFSASPEIALPVPLGFFLGGFVCRTFFPGGYVFQEGFLDVSGLSCSNLLEFCGNFG